MHINQQARSQKASKHVTRILVIIRGRKEANQFGGGHPKKQESNWKKACNYKEARKQASKQKA